MTLIDININVRVKDEYNGTDHTLTAAVQDTTHEEFIEALDAATSKIEANVAVMRKLTEEV